MIHRFALCRAFAPLSSARIAGRGKARLSVRILVTEADQESEQALKRVAGER